MVSLYLQLAVALILIIILAWFALKVVKIVIKVLLWIAVLTLFVSGSLSFLYAQGLSEIDRALDSGDARLRYISVLPQQSVQLQNQALLYPEQLLLVIDDSFLQKHLSTTVNGTVLTGPALRLFFSRQNSSEQDRILADTMLRISSSLLADPATKGYLILSQQGSSPLSLRTFLWLHEKSPSFVLRFLNFFTLRSD